MHTHTKIHTHRQNTYYYFEFERIQGSLGWCQDKIQLKSLAGVPRFGQGSFTSFLGSPFSVQGPSPGPGITPVWGFLKLLDDSVQVQSMAVLAPTSSNFSSFCQLIEEHLKESTEGRNMGAGTGSRAGARLGWITGARGGGSLRQLE